ncbi:hypothetical protein [Dankookia rubra]|nr:hypothetical protein [Dankookia rubra]
MGGVIEARSAEAGAIVTITLAAAPDPATPPETSTEIGPLPLSA